VGSPVAIEPPYRHVWVLALNWYHDRTARPPVKIAITGAGGLIGSALVPQLKAQGHHVIPIVRGAPSPGQIGWDPHGGSINESGLAGVDAVVHLAGAGVGDHRWSASYKREILTSRVDGTTLLARTLAALPTPPAVMLSGSAVGYYGLRGDEVLAEDAGPGDGFLADVCRQWERATRPAEEAGIRVVHLRTGVVLSAAGGALQKQLLPFKAGLGVRLGSGRQQFSWITRRDVAGALRFLLEHDLSGAVNVTAPNPVTNAAFTKALGRALHRPAVLALPAPLLRMAVGQEMASEFLQSSQRAIPQRLLEGGYIFADASLPGGLEVALHDTERTPLI
jgi:uncharacterized protein